MRALTLSGLIFGPDGSLIRQECKGPPTVEHWSACFAVFATAMIMLNACDFPHLTAYQVHFERLARQFGPACWAILYQAEARFRREGLERVRRDESDKLEVALHANGDYPFEPLRPWNRCFKVAPAQYHYWHTNVEVPCLLVLSRARTSGFFLDGDAETSSSSSAHVATQNAPQHELGLPGGSQADGSGGGGNKRASPKLAGAPQAKKQKTVRHDNISNGSFTSNRGGSPLCDVWQSGPCASKALGQCASNPSKRHQCAKCLSPSHGAFFPTTCNATPAAPKVGKSAGKGKKAGR
jgi:hypothetical protein